ncbi:hypothetical protein niasHS_008093 [Heterodera schachtii]|uniref:Uncharacterized protein n=1 Tax=Heterodera schachtii TaxID=97005 RepID=A0ABD2J7M8_HETSC
MVHGTQCICEICTCGRHQCPSDAALLHHHQHHQNRQQQQHDGIIGGGAENAEGHFYRKEFATVGNIAERATPTRPKDELSLPQGPFAQTRSGGCLRHTAFERPPNNARSTLSHRPALRRRAKPIAAWAAGLTSAEQQKDGGSSAMRSTYREQSERALERGTNGTPPGASRDASGRKWATGERPGTFWAMARQFRRPTRPQLNRTEYGPKSGGEGANNSDKDVGFVEGA